MVACLENGKLEQIFSVLTRILKFDVIWVKHGPAVFDIICELGSDVMNTRFDARDLYFCR